MKFSPYHLLFVIFLLTSKIMFVHFDSTAVHIINVQEDNRPEYQLLKTNGIFLNFAREPIPIYFEIYIPKNNSDWFATSAFVADDIVELAGTITKLEDNIITVCINYIV